MSLSNTAILNYNRTKVKYMIALPQDFSSENALWMPVVVLTQVSPAY
jgi:hypothetical protein